MIHDDLPVSVKLNSDDFRKGGFSHDDCLAVVARLNDDRIDLLENSGKPVRVLYEERFTQAAHGAGRYRSLGPPVPEVVLSSEEGL